jgi:molybdopterin-biosynthesis enzyme MoeA-like protein
VAGLSPTRDDLAGEGVCGAKAQNTAENETLKTLDRQLHFFNINFYMPKRKLQKYVSLQ